MTRTLSKLWLFVLLPLCGGPTVRGDQFFLSSKSFSIKTKVVSASKTKVMDILHVQEMYSIGQRRAKLQYALSRFKDRLFFYDANLNWAIHYDPNQRQCEIDSLVKLNEQLYGRSGKLLEFVKSEFTRGTIQDRHIVGPAQLLFLVARQASQLKRQVDQAERKVRNHAVVKLSMQLANSDGYPINLSAYYDKVAYSSVNETTNNIKLILPLRISLTTEATSENDCNELHFDFQQLKLLAEDGPRLEQAGGSQLDGSNRVFDEFAFPLTYNCSSGLGESLKVNLFETLDLNAIRFSFTCQINEQLGQREYSEFVAYDGLSRIMRIDMRQTTGLVENRDQANSKLLDFRANRLMTISYLASGSPDEPATKRPRCTTVLLKPDRELGGRLDVAEFLFGCSKFAYMGQAQLRGRNVKIYEGQTGQLPIWFSQQTVYRSQSGRLELRRRGERIDEKVNVQNRPSKTYALTIYLTDYLTTEAESSGGGQAARLVRMELHLPNKVGSSAAQRFRLVMSVDFRDFQWNLSETPDGDREQELFTAKSFCLEHDSRSAEVELQLESIDTEHNTADWINDWSKRQSAIMTGLHDLLGNIGTMIYDLEARMMRNKNRAKQSIAVSFKLAEQPKFVTELQFIGNSGVNPRPDEMFVTKAQSPVDCLWMVDARAGWSYFAYSEMSRTCIVDRTLDRSVDRSNVSKSSVFKLSPMYSNELFRVERYKNDSSATEASLLSHSVVAKLNNRLIVLQNVLSDAQHPIDHHEVRVRIKRVKFRDLAHTWRDPGKNNSNLSLGLASVFAGFKLSLGGGGNGRLVGDSISLSQCQAACLADLGCMTYSYCNDWPSSSCILSNTDFVGAKVAEQLSKLKVTNLRMEDKFSVISESGTIEELIRNVRCELFGKSYLRMYERGHNLEIDSLLSYKVNLVQTIEECARLCFMNTLQALLMNSTMSSEIGQLVAGGQLKNVEQIRDKIGHMQFEGQMPFERMCDYFLFSDGSINDAEANFISKALGEGQTDLTKARCFIYEKSDGGDSSLESSSVSLDVNYYRFDPSLLFEKRYGYRMADSKKTPEQQEAFKTITSGQSHSGADYQLVGEAIGASKNFQFTLEANVAECARRCLKMGAAIWPACKSFDILVNEDAGTSICSLNTLSIEEAAPEDIMREVESNITMHFEPTFGLVKRLTEQSFAASYSLGKQGSLIRSESDQTESPGSIYINVCMIAGLMSGIFVGIWLSSKFGSRVRQTPLEQQQIISQTRLDLISNQS